MADRWATFDCYGGIRGVFRQLWPDADQERLLRRHTSVEPLVQEGRALKYREVGGRTLRAIATIDGLPLDAADVYAFADSLPSWPAFPEVPDALRQLRANGWRLAILSNTDPELLAASLEQIGVPVDLRITAAEAGSYKPAHGHWQRFFAMTGADIGAHVHVAASLYHDIAPANDLGLTSVWINRLAEGSELPRAAELPDLSDLPRTLDVLVPTPVTPS